MEEEKRTTIKGEEVLKKWDDYRNFAFSKNLLAMAITLILANGMQKFVSTISETVLMPFINYAVSATGGNWRHLLFVPAEGLEIEIGRFFAGFLEFTITSFILFVIYRSIVKRLDPNATVEVNGR